MKRISRNVLDTTDKLSMVINLFVKPINSYCND